MSDGIAICIWGTEVDRLLKHIGEPMEIQDPSVRRAIFSGMKFMRVLRRSVSLTASSARVRSVDRYGSHRGIAPGSSRAIRRGITESLAVGVFHQIPRSASRDPGGEAESMIAFEWSKSSIMVYSQSMRLRTSVCLSDKPSERH